jgi:CheY-like chemotaxis protein
MARIHHPDAITLDLSMPGRHGVETFTELRTAEETSGIPVCIVTGHPEFRSVIYERPVPPPEVYMNKPVDEEKLLAYVERAVEQQAEAH